MVNDARAISLNEEAISQVEKAEKSTLKAVKDMKMQEVD